MPFDPRRLYRFVPLICMLAVPWSMPALASHIGDDLLIDQQTLASTDQMLGALRQWENAPTAVREARLQQLVQRAAERKQRLLHLLEHNPQIAAARLLPASVIDRLPTAARSQVEAQVQLSGSVFAEVASDVARGVSRQRFLFDAGGVRYQLALGDTAGGERDLLGWAGRRVTLSAARLDRQLLVRRKADVQVVALDSSVGTSTSSTPTTTPVVTGDQKTLVILANFNDKAVPCTAADVASRVFGGSGNTVNNGYLQSSRNLVSFSGTVAGPFTIPYSSTGTCDYAGWDSAAESAAKAAGFDPAQYKRVNIVTPSNGNCGWSGLAYMPGTRSWVQACTATGVFTHELGHNLSLHHAGSPTAEYGDGSDPMGGARTVRNNGANQVMAGWVPTGGVVDVTGSNTFTLAAIGPEAGTQPQVLRLPKQDTNERYYVSLRTAQGLDANLPSSYLNTVAVTKASGSLPAKTTLLASLATGQTWTDSVNGISVSNQALSGSLATVGVTFGGGSCARSAPTIGLTPTSQGSTPGVTVGYTVSVVNTNTATCGSTIFNLAASVPAGLSGSVTPSSLTLSPGSGANATVSIGSVGSAADGSYGFDVTASESGAANSGTAHGTLVLTRDSTLPVVAITSPSAGASLTGNRVTLAATASDNVAVARVEFYDGNTLLGSDASAPYTLTWNLRKVAKGPHTLTVRAIDTAGNSASASVSVTVQ